MIPVQAMWNLQLLGHAVGRDSSDTGPVVVDSSVVAIYSSDHGS